LACLFLQDGPRAAQPARPPARTQHRAQHNQAQQHGGEQAAAAAAAAAARAVANRYSGGIGGGQGVTAAPQAAGDNWGCRDKEGGAGFACGMHGGRAADKGDKGFELLGLVGQGGHRGRESAAATASAPMHATFTPRPLILSVGMMLARATARATGAAAPLTGCPAWTSVEEGGSSMHDFETCTYASVGGVDVLPLYLFSLVSAQVVNHIHPSSRRGWQQQQGQQTVEARRAVKVRMHTQWGGVGTRMLAWACVPVPVHGISVLHACRAASMRA